jgi:hypothetical protein
MFQTLLQKITVLLKSGRKAREFPKYHQAQRRTADRAQVVAKKVGWKKYFDNLPLGWWVSGFDLKTMKPQEFGQFKPNEPILVEWKRAAKYSPTRGMDTMRSRSSTLRNTGSVS